MPPLSFRHGASMKALQSLALAVAAILLVAGCETPDPAATIEGMREKFELIPPRPSAFMVCHENGCTERTTVKLSAEQWGQVRAMFMPPSADPAQERQRISQTIGLMERLVAPQARTAGDLGGTFGGVFAGHGQMDCEDEAANTTQYLVMMKNDGLLRWYTPVGRQWRGFFIHGWPHTTAVVAEAGTGELWAVDSWFEDNGVPAHVLPLEQWRAGWSPAGKTGSQYEKPVGDHPPASTRS